MLRYASFFIVVALAAEPVAAQGTTKLQCGIDTTKVAASATALGGTPLTFSADSNRCEIEIAGDQADFVLTLSAKKVIDSVLTTSAVELTSSGAAAELPTTWSRIIRFAAHHTQNLDLRIVLRDTTTPEVMTAQFRVRWQPAVELATTTADCEAGRICVDPEHPTTVRVSGANLQELATGETAFLRDAATKNSIPVFVSRSGKDVLATIPRQTDSALAKLIANQQFLGFTRVGGGTFELPQPVSVKKEELTAALEFPRSRDGLELFLGERRVVDLQLKNNSKLPKSGTKMTVFEGAGTNRRPVAEIEVLDTIAGRAVGLSLTGRQFRKGEVQDMSVEYKVPGTAANDTGKTISLHARLRVIEPPTVSSVVVVHRAPDYSRQVAHPDEVISLRINGKSLQQFDSLQSADNNARAIWPAVLWTDNQVVYRIAVPSTANTDSLLLRFYSHLVPDTVLRVPVEQPQRMRDFGFASVSHEAKSTIKFWPFFRAWRVDTIPLSNAVGLKAQSLNRVHILFRPDVIDRANLFGPQYLIADVSLMGPDNAQIARDSVPVVVVPAGSSYTLQKNYRNTTDIDVDELLNRAPRHSTPGSYLEIRLRHDVDRYDNKVALPTTIRLTNTRRVAVTPRVDVLTGLSYMAKVAKDDSTRRLVPNGTGSDTLVHHAVRQDLVLDFLDVTGGAAASVDIDYLRRDLRPTWLRARIGVLAVTDPFEKEKRRRIALAALYPIDLLDIKGAATLSLALGYGKILGGRGLFILAPGIGFSIPKL